MLVESRIITADQLSKALQLQRNTGRKLGEVLTADGLVDEKNILNLLEVQLGIQYLDLEKYYIDPEIPRLVSENIVRKHCYADSLFKGLPYLLPLPYLSFEFIKQIL